MIIRDINGYEEFKKHCSFEPCGKRYPGWVGKEKYIVITDEDERSLLESFPQIMKALSPYVIVGRSFSRLNEAERYNTNKHASGTALSINSAGGYEDLAKGFVTEDFSERLCDKDAVCRALMCLTSLQRSRVERLFFAGMTLKEIAREDAVSVPSVHESISSALAKMRAYLSPDLEDG